MTGRLTTNAVRSGYFCPLDEGWLSGCKTLAHRQSFRSADAVDAGAEEEPDKTLTQGTPPYSCLPPFMILYSMPSTSPKTVNVPPTIAHTLVTKSYHLRPFDETTTAMGDKS